MPSSKHGGSTPPAPQQDLASHHDPSQSARFRIVVDAMGRVVPRIIPPETSREPARDPSKS